MANVVLESGDGTGQTVKVAADGSVPTAVTNTVDTRPAAGGVTRTEVSVATTGSALVSTNADRHQIQIQNLDGANPVHIRLAGGSAAVTDLRIDPGQIYSFPPGVSYTGDITGKAVGAAVAVIVVEFNE